MKEIWRMARECAMNEVDFSDSQLAEDELRDSQAAYAANVTREHAKEKTRQASRHVHFVGGMI